jgi:hypothetical protein
LGITPDRILEVKLLALVHVVPTNELNFVVLTRVNYDFDEINKIVTQARKTKSVLQVKEVWECRKLLPISAAEITNFSGKWRKHFKKSVGRDKHRLDRVIVALHYYSNYRPSSSAELNQ